ncbi:histidine-rich glycoprotein isoform X1 [Penaeus vannamei]|uniref:histidine-rich glycoprotein isoform X1 n=1 Tax=Penaeus vannamei TaxID=6689 RepID=UPI00387F9C92
MRVAAFLVVVAAVAVADDSEELEDVLFSSAPTTRGLVDSLINGGIVEGHIGISTGHGSHGHHPGHGHYPGGHYPGGHYPGGHYPGGHYPGGHYPGGHPPGGHYPGGHYPGGHYPDGHYPGGHYPGGHPPGGHPPGGHYPGGHYPDGHYPGGHYPGGHYPGGHPPGGHYPSQGGHYPSQGGHYPSQGGHYPSQGGQGVCKVWCRGPNNKRYCCGRDVSQGQGNYPVVRSGSCPAVRASCPPTHLGGSQPNACAHDGQCLSPADKCCFDVCLGHQVCKPAYSSLGR